MYLKIICKSFYGIQIIPVSSTVFPVRNGFPEVLTCRILTCRNDKIKDQAARFVQSDLDLY